MKRNSDDSTGDIQNHANESVVRTTGRVKKPKTVFDPSDNYVSRAQRTAAQSAAAAASAIPATNSEQFTPAIVNTSSNTSVASASASITETIQTDYGKGFDTCQKCLKSEPRRGQGFKSKFLTCKGCTKKCHIDCQNIDFENVSLARKRYKCEACRVCSICFVRKLGKLDSQKQIELVVCSACLQAFHIDCHSPILHKSTLHERTFKCAKCVNSVTDLATKPLGKKLSQAGKRSKTPDQQQCDTEEIQSKLENVQPNVDTKLVKLWSVDDVVAFFTKYYPKEAKVFKEQDIDGASLLLLRRRDIIKRFNLKLGPSLRIFELISSLQTRKDVIENAWND